MLEELIVKFKRTLWDKKPSWQSLCLVDLPDELRKLIHPADIAAGRAGIWLSPYVTDSEGQLCYLMWLDVEDPDKHHTSIQANIYAAIELFIRLTEMGLTEDLVISLTGKGLRFSWPYLIGPEWAKEFMAFISDTETWPGIDPSPQEKKSLFRVAAYRGNSKQGQPELNVHTYFLPQARDILNLNEARYIDLTKGRPTHPDQYLEDLKRISPVELDIPKEWIALFKFYRTILRLRSHIVKIGFQKKQNSWRTNWPLIHEHLDKLGITSTELQFGATRIFRLSICPECGKREGSPFLTMSGRLKCFRASCRGSQSRQGESGGPYWGGLTAGEWVVGYESDPEGPGEEEELPESKNIEFSSIESARWKIKEAIRNA